MLAAGRQHKYILCITDAFTKYALITAVKNKEMVAKAIFSEWFCKFGIPAKFTLTAGRSLLTSSQTIYLHYLMYNIQRQLQPIRSAMPRLKFSTKPSKSI
jgi:hypothetical protein